LIPNSIKYIIALGTIAGGRAVTNELVSIDSVQTLTVQQYSALADVPPEIEWLANITNAKTRRFYKKDVAEFLAFTGLQESAQIRTVARSHVIAWRKYMELRFLSSASIRRKLSALSSLFDYLCERNTVLGNPVDSVKRPTANNNEGSTPALGYAQARRLLDAPPLDTLKGVSAEAIGVCVHSMRATAATNALSNEADIAKVQEWLGHANVSTTRLYDRRKGKPEDSLTFHVKY
jgi:site-specific recombinase XerD